MVGFYLFFFRNWTRTQEPGPSADSQSFDDEMREELAAARVLHDQRSGCVVFTVGGAEVSCGQWKPDVVLFQ